MLKRAVRTVIPPRLLAYTRSWRINRWPDRVILRSILLPAFSHHHPQLWIGCQRYTKSYYGELEQRGAICWTLDIDPDAARWGRRGSHVVGDLLKVDGLFAPRYFDAILCNGVFGFGINELADQQLAVRAMRGVIKPHGILLLGWDTDRIGDPVESGLLEPHFEHSGLPGIEARIEFETCTHVYDVFHARDDQQLKSSTLRSASAPSA